MAERKKDRENKRREKKMGVTIVIITIPLLSMSVILFVIILSNYARSFVSQQITFIHKGTEGKKSEK